MVFVIKSETLPKKFSRSCQTNLCHLRYEKVFLKLALELLISVEDQKTLNPLSLLQYENTVDQIGLFEKKYIDAEWHSRKNNDLGIHGPKS